MNDVRSEAGIVNAAPQGAINEAIATLDHIGRFDLGSAVKDLWAAWREHEIRASDMTALPPRREP